MSEPTDKTTVRSLAEIAGPAVTVAVREVETPKGERMEVESLGAGRRVRLDAVALESLTWQDRSTFERFLEETADDLPPERVVATADADDAGVAAPDDAVGLTEITNEFAHVVASEARTADGSLLQLVAPKMDYAVYLNAAALHGVAHQPPETFTELLRRKVE